jgi:hypothetical protein
MSTDSTSDPRVTRDREAIEQLVGHPLPQVWPTGALAPGTRVRVIRDADWNGPWATEFLGTIDTVGAPEPVQHPHARPGELSYWVKFDEPQFDHAHDGPYRGAQIWDRYLQPLTGPPTDQAD